MKKIIIILGLCIFCLSCKGQSDFFTTVKETVKYKNATKGSVAGYSKNKLTFLQTDKSGNLTLQLYDESTDKWMDSIAIFQPNNKIIKGIVSDDLLIFNGYLELPEEYKTLQLNQLPIDKLDYQDFWMYMNETNYKIATFQTNYIDKHIDFKLSENGKYLILNFYYAGIDILSDTDDNKIIIYDLSDLDNNKIIECEKCYNTYIINDWLIFGKEYTYYDGLGNEYVYSNIYKSPINNINDTVVVARNIELVNISDDGQYILGRQRLYGKDMAVVVNVDKNTYQYIVGMEYLAGKNFYSTTEKKFAFDFSKSIIYVELPTTYTHNALKGYKPTTKLEDKQFWDKNGNVLNVSLKK